MSTIVWSLRPVWYGLYGSDHVFLFLSCAFSSHAVDISLSKLCYYISQTLLPSTKHWSVALISTMLLCSYNISLMLCPKYYAIWIHLHSSCMLFFLSSSLKSINGSIHDRLPVLRGRPFMQHFRTFSQALIEWPPFSVIMHAPDIALLSNTSIHFLKHFHALNFLI